MKKYLTIILALMAVCCKAQTSNSNSATGNFVPATSEQIQYVGRMTLRSGQYAEFSYPGLQISACFTGQNIAMKAKPKSGYFMVQVDAGEPYKVNVTTDSVVSLARNLKDTTHTIYLTYINEGAFTKPRFYGFLLDANAQLVTPPTLSNRKIEFIGNSITCALGIEAPTAKTPAAPSNQNQYLSFEAITCRNLNAQCMVVARSGIGIYRNCLGNPQGDKDVMPALYPYCLFNREGGLWDFARFTPDVVCINLGTNDTTNPSYDVELLYRGFYNFYKDLRKHYPNAKIVLLTGSIVKRGTTRFNNLTGVLNRLQKAAASEGDHEVYRLDMTSEDGSMGYGAAYHPSVKRHAQMATELTKYLKEITGWE